MGKEFKTDNPGITELEPDEEDYGLREPGEEPAHVIPTGYKEGRDKPSHLHVFHRPGKKTVVVPVGQRESMDPWDLADISSYKGHLSPEEVRSVAGHIRKSRVKRDQMTDGGTASPRGDRPQRKAKAR
jgi:predicted RNA binding protein YcfA (HicA-like mRNA interferase family)